MANVILAERLTKSYGRKRGVIDLDFVVPPGQVFGYLGPNGAGKTTSIKGATPWAASARAFSAPAGGSTLCRREPTVSRRWEPTSGAPMASVTGSASTSSP
jgi:ABC-type branched-subunit amino acid transport system ATPase component